MKIRAIRGVCIGVDRHLKAGDTADLEPALVTYLVGIGAVALVADEPKSEPVQDEPKTDEPEIKPVPEKSGKKEK